MNDIVAGCSPCACGVPGSCDPYIYVPEFVPYVIAFSLIAFLAFLFVLGIVMGILLWQGKVTNKRGGKVLIFSIAGTFGLLLLMNLGVVLATGKFVNPAEEVRKGAERCEQMMQSTSSCEY